MKYFKDIVYGVIILVIGGTLIYQLFYKPVKTENNVASIIKLDRQLPKVYKDSSGKTHVQKEIIYVTNAQALLLYRNQLDSVSTQLKVKDNQIAALTTAAGRAEYKFKPNIEAIEDSLKNLIGQKISYDSKWFSLQGNTTKADSFKATFRDSVTIAFVKKKYGILNLKERLVADVYSANPDMKYENVKSWMVPSVNNNKSRIGFGTTIGYGLQLNKNNDISYGFQLTGGLQLRF